MNDQQLKEDTEAVMREAEFLVNQDARHASFCQAILQGYTYAEAVKDLSKPTNNDLARLSRTFGSSLVFQWVSA